MNFRGNFYCHSLATVVVDINMKTLKRNGILEYNRLRLFTRKLFKIKVPQNLAIPL